MKFEDKKIKILILIALYLFFNMVNYVYAVERLEEAMEFVEEFENMEIKNQKVAYLTFDDGPSIYTNELLEVLNVYEVPGIFFVLGSQLEVVTDADETLNRIIGEGHYIALHTMTHDKNALYWTEKSPTTFTTEMFELKHEIQMRTGHVTRLCRAPYGKKGHFKLAHHKAVEDAGLYCIDWHIDSQDWAKKNADEIYNEVLSQLEQFKDADEIVLLFHEYQRTVDVLPRIIELLMAQKYTFEPYVEGKVFKGLE